MANHYESVAAAPSELEELVGSVTKAEADTTKNDDSVVTLIVKKGVGVIRVVFTRVIKPKPKAK